MAYIIRFVMSIHAEYHLISRQNDYDGDDDDDDVVMMVMMETHQ